MLFLRHRGLFVALVDQQLQIVKRDGARTIAIRPVWFVAFCVIIVMSELVMLRIVPLYFSGGFRILVGSKLDDQGLCSDCGWGVV